MQGGVRRARALGGVRMGWDQSRCTVLRDLGPKGDVFMGRQTKSSTYTETEGPTGGGLSHRRLNPIGEGIQDQTALLHVISAMEVSKGKRKEITPDVRLPNVTPSGVTPSGLTFSCIGGRGRSEEGR